MEIAEYLSSMERQSVILSELRKLEWGVGKFLLRLLTERTFEKMLGGA